MWSTLIVVLSLLISAYRIQILTRGVDKKISFRVALKAIFGYEFLSAVTPFGSGGQPLEIWILKKHGVSIGKGLVIVYIHTASFILFLTVFGPLALVLYPELLHGITVPSFLIYGMIFPLYFVVLTYLSIFKPRFAKKVTHSVLKLLRHIKLMKAEKFVSTLKHAIREINTFNIYIKQYFSGKLHILLYAVFLTLLFNGVKFMSVFTIGLSFGLILNPVKIILAQTFIFFVNYFIPTPGSAGTTEMVALSIFKKIVAGFEVVVLVLWRFFTFYLIVLISAFPALKAVHMKEQEEELPKEDPIPVIKK